MTAVRHWPVQNGWRGAKNRALKVDFTVNYMVETDDPQDGTQEVVGAIGIDIGDTYAFGNDTDPLAYCKSIRPSPISTTLWRVEYTYGPPDNQNNPDEGQPDGRDEAGEPVDDPLNEADRITVDLVQMTKPAREGIYRGVIDGAETPANPRAVALGKNGTERPVNSNGPVVNSALVPFDPTIEVDYSRMVLRISKNLAAYNADLYKEYVDSVNSVAFVVNKIGLNLNLDPFTGKMQSIDGIRKAKGAALFWEVTFEIHIDDTFTWRFKLHDESNGVARAQDGDTDGKGGSLSVLYGQPHVRAATDYHGMGEMGKLPLDQDGQPRDPADAARWLVYSLYPEKDWTPLGI